MLARAALQLRGSRPLGVGRAVCAATRHRCRMMATSEEESQLQGILGVAYQDISALRRQRMHINSQITELENILEEAQKDLGVKVSDQDLEKFAGNLGFTPGEDDDEMPEHLDEALMLDILPAGHSVLYKEAEPVPESMFNSLELGQLVDKMLYTMTMYDGIGLAAPQIGQSLQLVVLQQDAVDDSPRPDRVLPALYLADMREEDFPSELPQMVLVNPVINPTKDSRQTVYFESCLSIPGYYALVPRHSEIDVEARDIMGNTHRFTAVGWQARVIQHEVDHLNGVLFTDRMVPQTFAADEAFLVEHLQGEEEDDVEEGGEWSPQQGPAIVV